MQSRPIWTDEELNVARLRAIAMFQHERLGEPLEAYLDNFDEYQAVLENLLERTVDLTVLEGEAVNVLTDEKLLEGLRYLTGPPISTDDLKVVAEATLSASRIRANDEMVKRIIRVILDGLDRRRFPWVAEGREATDQERTTAIVASAALIAMRRTETSRRKSSKDEQEDLVEGALLGLGFMKVPTRKVETMSDAPRPGEFCRESTLSRKADFIVGLHDRRLMPIECKVSNSSTNSVKRLNNDAAVKAETWRKDFGEVHVVPTAVLSGVYKLHNLRDAQRRGLTLFWAHDLESLVNWISSTGRVSG